MFLNKKKKISAGIGDIVEVLRADIDKVDSKFNLVNQRISYYHKFIIINISVFNGVKFARLIDLETNYSKEFAYKKFIKKKQFKYVKLDSLDVSRTTYNDVFTGYGEEYKSVVFESLKLSYGLNINKQ